jgi:hypothetical protein
LAEGLLTWLMSTREIVEQLLQMDSEIRWVGVVDDGGNILQNVQRPGTKNLVDPKTEERTLKEFPTIMGLFWRELVGRSGRLNYVVVSYSRVYLMAFYVQNLLVVLSFEPSALTRVIGELETKYGPLQPTGSG